MYNRALSATEVQARYASAPEDTETLRYYLGGKEVAFKRGDTLYFPLQDHLSSSAVITNSSGALVESTVYYPYGATRTGSIATTEEKFTGQRLDGTGLYFYGARYYDPNIGRFVSPDTIVQNYRRPASFNRYAYAFDNPLKYTDPSGNVNVSDIGSGGWPEPPWWERVRDKAERAGELMVDTAKQGLTGQGEATRANMEAERAAGNAMVEGGQWVVGIDTVITVTTSTGTSFTNVVAQDSGLNIVNKVLDVLNADAVAVGGPIGVLSETPLTKQEDIDHEGTHIAEQEDQGWIAWHFEYEVEYWFGAAVLYGDLDEAYQFHPAENRARDAAGQQTYDPTWDDYWWWP